MEAIPAIVALLIGVLAGAFLTRRTGDAEIEAGARELERLAEQTRRDAETIRREAEVEAREIGLRARTEAESAVEDRRAEVARLEERATQRAAALDRRSTDLDRREVELSEQAERARSLEQQAHDARIAATSELERASGLTRDEARAELLRSVEESARRDMARTVRQIEEEARADADQRARSVLATAIQRLASAHANEATVAIVTLPSDDVKGRIIGREGRNIRAFEAITGVDVIIDDTPGAVALSSFDGVRRETARLTLEKLIQDGRIQPSRIEEAYYQAKHDVDEQVAKAGEQAAFEANVAGVDPELLKILGRLRFRTSYAQNVLKHSLEVAHLGAMMAAELGANEKVTRRAALLHDIGKAMTHELEGPHALISGQLCRRFGESEAVAHAAEAHHFDVQPETVEAVLVQAADAISAARPGARGESLESYMKRLTALEQIATSKPGVERCYAMQAGRDIRVMVKPGEIDDDEAALLARDIAREIEETLEYPGQIKVTVIRESRHSEVAR